MSDTFEKIFIEAITGIKCVKRQKRIKKFNLEDGVFSDFEAGKVYVPGRGIVESEKETTVFFDCSHPANFGIGHIADCGHVICKLCVQRYVLVCAHPGCFKKLCTVKGCSNRARMMSGVYFCKKHQFSELMGVLGSLFLFGRRRTQEIIDEIKQEYYSGFLPEKKDLPYGR